MTPAQRAAWAPLCRKAWALRKLARGLSGGPVLPRLRVWTHYYMTRNRSKRARGAGGAAGKVEA